MTLLWCTACRTGSEACPGPVLQQLQHLRQRMAWMVANLQIYLQQDVIESSFDELQVRCVQRFFAIYRLHA